jgi:serine protease Do
VSIGRSASLFVFLSIGCFQCRGGEGANRHAVRDQPDSAVVIDARLGSPRQCLPVSFAELAAAADQAVVQVRTMHRRPSRSGRRQVASEGLGSAFIYDPGGKLLTNYHVVANASEILVALRDGRELSATVIGADPPTDVAVLQVNGSGLPSVTLGSSERLRVGDWVLAIGNPFGLSHTVSAGIVSAKERTIDELESVENGPAYVSFLQTDASINPGNSGGPMIDLDGKVVGISTAIRAHSNNIGFAIPIDMVSELLPALVSAGRIRRSALGITVDRISPQESKRLLTPNARGPIVREVQPGGPAQRAGIRVDDIVLEFDGRSLDKPERLQWLASMAGVGHVAKIRLFRNDRTLEVSATLTELRERPLDDSGREQE